MEFYTCEERRIANVVTQYWNEAKGSDKKLAGKAQYTIQISLK
ncbi:hypothetical protein [Wolbachia endosymbiont of Onchocerca ochengi]|nr:hypothetical protein [Wolbachia endosymbiont of Onchocerca ochengi]